MRQGNPNSIPLANGLAYLKQNYSVNKDSLIAFLCILGTTIATTILYIPFISNKIVFDDHNLFTTLSVYQYAQIPFDLRPRTFPYFTLGFVQVMFDSIEANRIVSVGLHITCSFVLFCLIKTLLQQAATGADATKHQWINSIGIVAIIPTLWFAINPVAVYGAGYLVQRTILFATLFSLLSIWYFCRAFAHGRMSDIITAALLYSLAVFSKEHAIALPLAVLPIATLYQGKRELILKHLALYLLLCAPAAITVVMSVKSVVSTAYEPDVGTLLPLMSGISLLQYKGGDWIVSILMQMSFFFDYLGYWIFPDVRSLSIDMRIDFKSLWGAWWLRPKAMLFLSCPFITAYCLKRPGLASLFGCGLFFSWSVFLTELVSVRFQEPFVLYRSYIWAPGYALMLAAVCATLTMRKMIALAIPILLANFFLAQERLKSLSDEGTVWKDAANKLVSTDVVGSGRIFYNRGRQYLKEKKFNQAIADFSHALEQNPKAYYAYYHRGTARYATGDLDSAINDFNSAQKLNDKFGLIYYSKGQVFEKLGCYAKAKNSYLESLHLGVALASIPLSRLKRGSYTDQNPGCQKIL